MNRGCTQEAPSFRILSRRRVWEVVQLCLGHGAFADQSTYRNETLGDLQQIRGKSCRLNRNILVSMFQRGEGGWKTKKKKNVSMLRERLTD